MNTLATITHDAFNDALSTIAYNRNDLTYAIESMPAGTRSALYALVSAVFDDNVSHFRRQELARKYWDLAARQQPMVMRCLPGALVGELVYMGHDAQAQTRLMSVGY